MMHEERFVSVSDYLDKLRLYSNPYWDFRGHADVSWDLIPSAGRSEYFSVEMDRQRKEQGIPSFDLSRFELWKKSAIAYKKDLPSNDFECLALAQHFGLATRLLDWSSNSLVALFFAVESCSSAEGCVYVYAPEKMIDQNILKIHEPSEVYAYLPPPLDNRILSQQGLFSYHPNPNEPLLPKALPENMLKNNPYSHDTNLIRFLIHPDRKSIIKRELDEIGFNRKYLFADLDGLSSYINWGTSVSIENKKRRYNKAL